MSTPQDEQSLVDRLKELGIPEKSARYALKKTNNDVERAANYVFSGAAGKDEVRAGRSRVPLETVPEDHHPDILCPTPRPTSVPHPASAVDASFPEDDEPPRTRGKVMFSSLPGRFRRRKAEVESDAQGDSNADATEPGLLTESSLSPLDTQASNLILSALDRGRNPSPVPATAAIPVPDTSKRTSGALAALGLRAAGVTTPISPPKSTEPIQPQATLQPSRPVGASSSAPRLPRSPSPFFRARRSREEARKRDRSPEVAALKKDSYESDGESVGGERNFKPQVSAYEDADESGTEAASDEEPETDLTDEEEEYLAFDEETEKNTEANAVFYEGDAAGLGGTSEPVEDRAELDTFGEEIEQDPLGEGPNVVVPPQPLFQVTFNQPVRRKSLKSGLELETSRPIFARDRCTINLTHGDPDGALEKSGKRMRRYVVLSDLSEESQYAVEWGIGTVARDGDELFVISVKEDEAKVDPKSWSSSDKAAKLRIQKERQTTALLLVKQVTGLLQRTRLNITVTCQFLHAKNARHMLLDLVDFLEPTMVIVGSRGLGKLKGILLGSTSHYLVQKSSVPVMRPLRRTNPANLRHSPRVSLASASIEKTASSKQEDEVVDVEQAEEAEEAAPDRRQSAPA